MSVQRVDLPTERLDPDLDDGDGGVVGVARAPSSWPSSSATAWASAARSQRDIPRSSISRSMSTVTVRIIETPPGE